MAPKRKSQKKNEDGSGSNGIGHSGSTPRPQTLPIAALSIPKKRVKREFVDLCDSDDEVSPWSAGQLSNPSGPEVPRRRSTNASGPETSLIKREDADWRSPTAMSVSPSKPTIDADGYAVQHDNEASFLDEDRTPETSHAPEEVRGSINRTHHPVSKVISFLRKSAVQPGLSRQQTQAKLEQRGWEFLWFYLEKQHSLRRDGCICHPKLVSIGIVASSNDNFGTSNHHKLQELRSEVAKTDSREVVIAISDLDGFSTNVPGILEFFEFPGIADKVITFFIAQDGNHFGELTKDAFIEGVSALLSDAPYDRPQDLILESMAEVGLNKEIAAMAFRRNKQVLTSQRNTWDIDPSSGGVNQGIMPKGLGKVNLDKSGRKYYGKGCRRKDIHELDILRPNIKHVALHKDGNNHFKCPKPGCNDAMSTLDKVAKHCLLHCVNEPELEFQCFLEGCSKHLTRLTTQSQMSIYKHFKRHFDLDIPCPQGCNVKLNMQEDVDYHVQQIHRPELEGENPDESARCYPCDKLYTSAQKLRVHQRAKHAEMHYVDCLDCGRAFSHLNIKGRGQHKSECSATGMKTCELCGFRLQHGSMKRHKLAVHVHGKQVRDFAREAGLGSDFDIDRLLYMPGFHIDNADGISLDDDGAMDADVE
ncbi:hypothetical protein KC330_g6637 [Hortaea werneckii]|nr:hypothetical protein KC330_g6637 [Hortaea werneckii]